MTLFKNFIHFRRNNANTDGTDGQLFDVNKCGGDRERPESSKGTYSGEKRKSGDNLKKSQSTILLNNNNASSSYSSLFSGNNPVRRSSLYSSLTGGAGGSGNSRRKLSSAGKTDTNPTFFISDHGQHSDYQSRSPEMVLSTQNFRLVIFKESDLSDRRLLFDSLSIRPRRISDASTNSDSFESSFPSPHHSPSRSLSPNPNPPRVPLSPDGKFEFHKHHQDTKGISEMIFGSMPMAYKGETFKIHQFKNQMMITKVFPAPRVHRTSVVSEKNYSQHAGTSGGQMEYSSDSDSQYSTVRSLDGILPGGSNCRSIPMDVPERMFKTPNSSVSSRTGKWTLEGEEKTSPLRIATPNRIVRSISAFGPSSPHRLPPTLNPSPSLNHWRLRMCQAPSLEHISSAPSSAFRQHRSSIDSVDEDTESEFKAMPARRRPQIGMAILFDGDNGKKSENDFNFSTFAQENLNRFLHTHMQLIENDMSRLQRGVEEALVNKPSFFSRIYQVWGDFRSSIQLLYSAPRLREPVWLTLMGWGGEGGRRVVEGEGVAARWTSVLTRLVALLDTKDRNFFVSNLLTAVLQHHLSWVGSVAPGRNPCSSCTYQYQERWRRRGRRGGGGRTSPPLPPDAPHNTANSNPPSFPYNVYWAQYADVTGALGYPVKQAKTVVVGEDVNLVEQLLFFLSYFIRSCDLRETDTSHTHPGPPVFPHSAPHSAVRPPSLPPSSPPKPTPNNSTSTGNSRTTAKNTPLPKVPSEQAKEEADSNPDGRRSHPTLSPHPHTDTHTTDPHKNLSSTFLTPLLHTGLSPQLSPRPRSGSLIGNRRLHSEEARQPNLSSSSPLRDRNSSDPKPAASIIQTGSRRFEVFPVVDAPYSSVVPPLCAAVDINVEVDPTVTSLSCGREREAGFLLGRGLESRSKSYSEPVDVCVSLKNQKMRKVSASALCRPQCSTVVDTDDRDTSQHREAVDQFRMEETQPTLTKLRGRTSTSPKKSSATKSPSVVPSQLSSDEEGRESGNYSSGAEDHGKENSEKNKKDKNSKSKQKSIQSTGIRSIDSGIEEIEALALMEDSREKRTDCPRSGETGESETAGKKQPPESPSKSFAKHRERPTKTANSQHNCTGRHDTVFGESILDEIKSSQENSNNLSCSSTVEVDAVDSGDHNTDAYRQADTKDSEASSIYHLSSIGRSLIGGYVGRYNGHFALSGVAPSPTIYTTISEDLNSSCEHCSNDNEDTTQVACIVANTKDWTVKVVKSGKGSLSLRDADVKVPAHSVASLIENATALESLSTAPDFCLTYVEGCLEELWAKSVLMGEAIEGAGDTVDVGHLTRVVDCDWSDLPLLMSVASVHSPHLMSSLTA